MVSTFKGKGGAGDKGDRSRRAPHSGLGIQKPQRAGGGGFKAGKAVGGVAGKPGGKKKKEKKPSIKQQIRGIERCDILGVVLCVYCIPPTFAVAACRRV
jgi:hypothetical protein